MTKFARIFVARSGTSAIIVTMHQNQDGIWHEDNSPTVLSEPLSAEAMGVTVMQAFGRTGYRDANLRDSKLTDWPSLKASGIPVVRQFEQSHITLTVKGVNDANLVAVIEGEPEKNAELRISSVVATTIPPSEIGRRILRVYEACRDRRL